jgi:hypothetical protein
MDDAKIKNELMTMSPADYTRLMEAAKQRAHALRREAIGQFWSQAAAWVMQGLRFRREAKPSLHHRWQRQEA